MGTELLLGVDIGTSSLKLGIIDSNSGEFIDWSESKYQLIHPADGYAELPADKYFEAFINALNILAKKINPKDIKAISVSSQAQTFVSIDNSGKPLHNAISWLDARASRQAEQLNAIFSSDEIFGHTGIDSISPGMFAAMIKYIRDNNEKDIYRYTWKFMHIASYLIYRLTGRIVWDENIAGMSGVYDWPERKYWTEMLDAIGIDEDKLPEVLPCGTLVDKLKCDCDIEPELSDDVCIVTGANDQTANAIGAGIVDESKTLIVLGTALIGFRVNSQGGLPSDDKGYHGICSVYPISPMSYQLGYTNSGCGSLDWAKEIFADNEDYENIFANIAKIPIGSEGVIDLIDIDGRAWPANINYRGTFAGMSRKTDKWTMLRAVVEGICFATRELIELMNWDLTGGTVRIVGGATRSEIWLDILANVLSVPLERLSHEQSGVMGAAIMAGVGSGIFKDYPEAIDKAVKTLGIICPQENKAKQYLSVYRRFKKLRKCMDEFY